MSEITKQAKLVFLFPLPFLCAPSVNSCYPFLPWVHEFLIFLIFQVVPVMSPQTAQDLTVGLMTSQTEAGTSRSCHLAYVYINMTLFFLGLLQ